MSRSLRKQASERLGYGDKCSATGIIAYDTFEYIAGDTVTLEDMAFVAVQEDTTPPPPQEVDEDGNTYETQVCSAFKLYANAHRLS